MAIRGIWGSSRSYVGRLRLLTSFLNVFLKFPISRVFVVRAAPAVLAPGSQGTPVLLWVIPGALGLPVADPPPGPRGHHCSVLRANGAKVTGLVVLDPRTGGLWVMVKDHIDRWVDLTADPGVCSVHVAPGTSMNICSPLPVEDLVQSSEERLPPHPTDQQAAH